MRLIDADALCREMKIRQDACKKWVETASDAEIKARAEGALSAFSEFKLTIDKQPTVDAVPVKHGRWIRVVDNNGQHQVCEFCGEWKYHTNQKFCGECGARLDGKEK